MPAPQIQPADPPPFWLSPYPFREPPPMPPVDDETE
jgi:hypothetical protein